MKMCLLQEQHSNYEKAEGEGKINNSRNGGKHARKKVLVEGKTQAKMK